MTSKQAATDPADVLDNIALVQAAVQKEIDRVDKKLRQRVAEAHSGHVVGDALYKEIAGEIGRLSAKVELSESALKSLQSRLERSKRKNSVVTPAPTDSDSSMTVYTAHQLSGTLNLLPLESTPGGISYCWTGTNPETQFSFDLDRSKALGIYIRLTALIKPEYSKQLKVVVAGQHLPHSFSRVGDLYVVSAVLPAARHRGQTDIKIILPATHKPMDISDSLDGRQLGIAISEIGIGKPESMLIRLLRKLRLKK